MKKLLFIVLSALIVVGVALPVSVAADTKKTQKERRTEMRKTFDEKASKNARKRAKELAKEGWMPIGGGETLEAQLERAWKYAQENEDYDHEYLVRSASAVANTKSAAQKAAMRNASLEIGKALESEIAALWEGEMDNETFSDEDVSTRERMKEVSQGFMQSKLKKLQTLSEWYRKTPNGKYEVEVTAAIRISTLKEELREKWLNESQAKTDQLRDKLSDKIDNGK